MATMSLAPNGLDLQWSDGVFLREWKVLFGYDTGRSRTTARGLRAGDSSSADGAVRQPDIHGQSVAVYHFAHPAHIPVTGA